VIVTGPGWGSPGNVHARITAGRGLLLLGGLLPSRPKKGLTTAGFGAVVTEGETSGGTSTRIDLELRSPALSVTSTVYVTNPGLVRKVTECASPAALCG
jgi:hypothetical protein